MDIVIAICVFLSYFLGSKAILDNKYQPSIYSRVIWFFFAINNFASVFLLGNSFAVLVLAGLGLIGNLVILILSLKKSKKEFGKTEVITSALLVLSVFVWLLTKLPLLNLTIGIVAHFIAGIPTYKKVIKEPLSEDTLFWFFFFAASSLALFKVDWTSLSNYLYPLYFAIFDGLMTFLCLRRYRIFK